MSESSSPSQAQLQFIISHPVDPKIALIATDDGWSLPTITPGTPMNHYYELYVAGYEIRKLWDWDVATMYQAGFFPARDFNAVRIVYALDNLDGRDDLPDDGRWFSSDALAQLDFSEAHIAGVLEKYFKEQKNGIPALRAPWGRRGWHRRTMQWLGSQLESQDYRQANDLEIMRVWCITALYKVPTVRGNLYLKAVPPTFTREIGVTRWLRSQFGRKIPEIIAHHEDERLMLMTDFGGTNLRQSDEKGSVATWQAIMGAYGELQAQTAPHTDTLFALGALDYRIDTLLPRFEALLQNDEYVNPNWSITAEQIEAARQSIPQVRRHIEALQGMALPNTILHGDLHGGNINLNGDQLIFYDWTDAAVGIPVLDLHTLTTWDLSEVFRDQPEVIDTVLDAYFEGLSSLAPKATWQEAYEHTRVVSIVYHAVNYQHMLSSIEPGERWIVDEIGALLNSLVEALSPST